METRFYIVGTVLRFQSQNTVSSMKKYATHGMDFHLNTGILNEKKTVL